MKQIHFIAIGGAVMHNLAIALHRKGYRVTGSDDEIFDPARSYLDRNGLLPAGTGWFPEKISPGLDAVILGMHARADNPELLRARELGLRVYSFPEYMYEQTRDKKRVVIGGSHGKTTITSMVMHVLRESGIESDYLVGSRLPGFDTMVGLYATSKIAVFEGDEYLSSPLDPRPKFMHYRPHIALLSGVAWDHMNVFPSQETYADSFRKFVGSIAGGGALVYCESDPALVRIAAEAGKNIRMLPYREHPHRSGRGTASLLVNGRETALKIFGRHNMENISGALQVCRELGVADGEFYRAIGSFTGAARRLEKVAENSHTAIYFDFAHSPSKVKATTEALAGAFPGRELTACLELHTFSSLNPSFLPHYRGTLDSAGRALVFFSPDTVAHKKLPPLSEKSVKEAFGRDDLLVFTDPDRLWDFLTDEDLQERNLLMMSSGNFGGKDVKSLASGLIKDNLF